MSDRIFAAIFVLIFFFIAMMMVISVRGYFDCRADNGKYVRGMFMYECVERNR